MSVMKILSAAAGKLSKIRCDIAFIVGGTSFTYKEELNEGAFVRIRQCAGVMDIFDQVVHSLHYDGFRKEPSDRRH